MSYLSGGARRRRRWPWVVAAAALLLAAGGIAAYLVVTHEPGDVSNSDVPFTVEQAPSQPKASENNFTWAFYGYTKGRTHYLPASMNLRPPYRQVWIRPGSVLLEFPPIMARKSLYVLKDNGSLYAISKSDGHIRWRHRYGSLAASSPAYGHNTVYIVLLKRFSGSDGGRVVAVSATDGHTLWSRKLPSRSESSPLLHQGTLYFGTESGRVFALRARDGAIRWTFEAGGAVKGGIAYADGKLFFGTYGGHVYALRPSDGKKVWAKSASTGAFGLRSANFYSTPAVAYGRVFLGNTDGAVYSFSTANGALGWRHGTGSYIYASPAVAQVPGTPPTVYIGSYDGYFYALSAQTGRQLWRHKAGGKISGSATVVGDIVYFSNLHTHTTTGLGVRTGKQVYFFKRGGFNPVISDGKRIYLVAFSTIYALQPGSKQQELAAQRAARRAAYRKKLQKVRKEVARRERAAKKRKKQNP
jgi:outer membrane protein assembly factor BamB